jgi:predicted DNA-binding helix-hairpin-helix protein
LGPRSVERLLRWRRQAQIRDMADLGRAGAMTARAAPFVLLAGARPPRQLPLWDREPDGSP